MLKRYCDFRGKPVSPACEWQRVRRASVSVGSETVAEIGIGLLVLAAVEKGDGEQSMRDAARKIREMRIFADDAGKMNRDVAEAGGAILAVSQFTLAASLERGRRPSFDRAEEPQRARAMLADPRYNQMKVGEIATTCGFNEVPYFNRCFRRRFGTTPTQYRGSGP